ncbi:hypothetical protein PUNSTDRAFT_121806 [Punctularia strigosozonata HHB-11173 SS5]|uniref:uncharacterized protein n=1 Tax=Punctularia strigosozonata (strain HHB-11173) TaxID=741275 RepID=UPI0004416994|nr:uncharacterized protein PUNSTDRAFT_121806 [Punctularia strigosozonata HHB-11173 SS5]EIN06687.1 hypothetical protein PUNSTDRAFT_121806 [Punctularia strigosozonata HHB-11173 SS5]
MGPSAPPLSGLWSLRVLREGPRRHCPIGRKSYVPSQGICGLTLPRSGHLRAEQRPFMGGRGSPVSRRGAQRDRIPSTRRGMY